MKTVLPQRAGRGAPVGVAGGSTDAVSRLALILTHCSLKLGGLWAEGTSDLLIQQGRRFCFLLNECYPFVS